jgi:hypothetical protein
VYEKPMNKPFKSVSEYFKLLEEKTGVKFTHPSTTPYYLPSSLLIQNSKPTYVQSNHRSIKDNVLLFKTHNADVQEYTKADKLILWPNYNKAHSTVRQHPKQKVFEGEIEGFNPHWRWVDHNNGRQELQNAFMDFEQYSQIERNLRLARNVFMQEHGNPAVDVAARSKGPTRTSQISGKRGISLPIRMKNLTAGDKKKPNLET